MKDVMKEQEDIPGLCLVKALPADFEKVKAAYKTVINDTPDLYELTRWEYGIHPDDELIRSCILEGSMYLLKAGDTLMGMMAVSPEQREDYQAINWNNPLFDDEVSVIHILAVLPEHKGKGIGRRLVEEACELSLQMGKSAVRLDVIVENIPARRLYEQMGFIHRGRQEVTFDAEYTLSFLYYEKEL